MMENLIWGAGMFQRRNPFLINANIPHIDERGF